MVRAITPQPDADVVPSTRELIVDAAELRFAHAGFAGTSMRDIASDAGLRNQASLYHYFEHKQQLYEAVLRRVVGSLAPLWDAGYGRGQPTLIGGIDAVVDVLAARPHLARLIERAGFENDAEVREIVSRVLRPLFDAGVRALRVAGSRWDESELDHVAAGLYHLIFGYFANDALLAAVMRDDPRTPAMIARQREFLRKAIARLLGEEAEVVT